MENPNYPIKCNERLIVKIWKTVGLFIGSLIMIYVSLANFGSIIFYILLLTYFGGIIIFLAGSPDFTVTEKGLFIKILWRDYFLEWYEVLELKSDPVQSIVILKRLTFFNRIIGLWLLSSHPAFQVGCWRKNYLPVMKIIRKNIQNNQR